MRESEIIQEIMEKRDVSFQKLAYGLGLESAGSTYNMINNRRTSMRVESFLRIMELLDCEVIVRDKLDGTEHMVGEDG